MQVVSTPFDPVTIAVLKPDMLQRDSGYMDKETTNMSRTRSRTFGKHDRPLHSPMTKGSAFTHAAPSTLGQGPLHSHTKTLPISPLRGAPSQPLGTLTLNMEGTLYWRNLGLRWSFHWARQSSSPLLSSHTTTRRYGSMRHDSPLFNM
jgi:hypothetical protein